MAGARPPQNVNVLAVLDFEALILVPEAVTDVLQREQTSEIQSLNLRTETRNLEIQDGKDVDVLQKPGLNK